MTIPVSTSWSGSDLPFDATGTNRPSAPGETVGPNGFLDAPPKQVGRPHHKGSRWSGDTVTLGRSARIMATVVLLLPAAWMLFFMGMGGVLFLALYGFVFLPVALRDVWRRTRISVPPVRTTPPRSP